MEDVVGADDLQMKTNFYIYNWLRANTAKIKSLFTYYALTIFTKVPTHLSTCAVIIFSLRHMV